MIKGELIRAVQNEARTGDRELIFENYRSQFSNPAILAAIIAGTARDADRKKYGALNTTLVVLLALCGLLKVLTIWSAASEIGPAGALIASVIGLAISLAFAYVIYSYNGRMYSFIAVLAGLALLRSLPGLSDDPIDAIVIIVLMSAIIALSVVLRQKLFPGLKFFGVKTSGTGQYVLG